MDDSSIGGSEAEESDGVSIAIGLAHIALTVLLVQCCCCRGQRCCCCCRRGRGSPGPANEAFVAHAGQLQPKKRVLTSYALWLVMGVFGMHHFYLGRVVHGLVSLCTLNLAGVGWLADLVLIPFYVRGFNSRRTAAHAAYDRSLRLLFCRLPVVVLALVSFTLGSLLYMPRALHAAGVVDIDRIAAQTQANPYEVLGLPQGASLSEAKKAYHRESLAWHPDRNMGCGERCNAKMSEIAKAFELIKKRRAPAPPDRTWTVWFKDILSDWGHILEVFSEKGERSSDAAAQKPQERVPRAERGRKKREANSDL